MSDPHRWDRYDRTLPRPLTRRRVVVMLGLRWFSVLLLTGLVGLALAGALHSSDRQSWTVFAFALLAWCIAVPLTVCLSVILISNRQR